MYLHLDLGLAGFFHSWHPASLRPVRRFSSSALPQGMCASQKSICRLGLKEANVHFSACLETTGGGSRSLTIHADQELIHPPWSLEFSKRNCRPPDNIFAPAFPRRPMRPSRK